MLLMLKVATFSKFLSSLYLWVRLPKGATEVVVGSHYQATSRCARRSTRTCCHFPRTSTQHLAEPVEPTLHRQPLFLHRLLPSYRLPCKNPRPFTPQEFVELPERDMS